MENELIELLEEFIDFLRMKDEEEVLVEEEEFVEPEQEEIDDEAYSDMLGDIANGG